MSFEIISEITDIEVIAVGSSIHDLSRLRKQYGRGKMEKAKRYCQSTAEEWQNTPR